MTRQEYEVEYEKLQMRAYTELLMPDYEYVVIKGLLGPTDHYYKCAKCGRIREELP